MQIKRPYRLYAGNAQCTNCRRNIRKAYIPHSNPRPVCNQCVNEVFNLKVTAEELSIPIWLIKAANAYFYHKVSNYQHAGASLHPVDLLVEFYAYENASIPELEAYPILKRGWKDAVAEHLTQLYYALKQDEQQQHFRKMIICPSCNKPMYSSGGKEYHCLTHVDVCDVSNYKTLFINHGGNRIERLLR